MYCTDWIRACLKTVNCIWIRWWYFFRVGNSDNNNWRTQHNLTHSLCWIGFFFSRLKVFNLFPTFEKLWLPFLFLFFFVNVLSWWAALHNLQRNPFYPKLQCRINLKSIKRWNSSTQYINRFPIYFVEAFERKMVHSAWRWQRTVRFTFCIKSLKKAFLKFPFCTEFEPFMIFRLDLLRFSFCQGKSL